MKRTLAILLVLVMTVGLLAACSSEEGNTEAGDGGAAAGNNEDREFVVALGDVNSNNFDPYNSYGTDNYGHMQVYNSLMKIDENREVVPDLAEKYELTPDGMEYTFYLKQGVKFHNGEELKASDVVFSGQRAIESAYTSADWSAVDYLEAVDDYTVKIHMKAPSMAFLETLAGSFAFIVNEKAVTEYGEDYGMSVEATIGTGPYILKEWKPGELAVYEANPDYFDGEPDIKHLRIKAISDTNTAVIALETGEIDYYMATVPPVSMESLSNNDSLTVVSYPSQNLTYSIINCETGIFTDVRMRQALAYAVDREKMLVLGGEGLGTIVNCPCGPDYTALPDMGSWYEYDPEKAKELIQEAGYEGASVTIKTYSTGAYPKLATSMQQDLSNVGLDVEVLQMERNAFINDVLGEGQYEIGICGFSSSVADMDVMYQHLHTANIGLTGNWSRYSSPEMDTLLEEARSETDAEARKELYRQAMDLYREEVCELPFYYATDARAFTKDVVTDYANNSIDKIYHFRWAD